MIEIKNISKSYKDKTALSDVCFSFSEGEIIALLGVNGAGKSTLMKILTGILTPDEGTVNIYGHNIERETIEAKRITGYLSEDNPLYEDMYVMEYLTYVANIYGTEKQRIKETIKETGLEKEYKKKINTLSRGNKQRVGIAQSILHNPKFIILDEPHTGLDPNQRGNLNAVLKAISQDKILLFSTHILQDVKDTCNRFIFINDGKIIADDCVENIHTIEKLFQSLANENNCR